MIITEFTDNDLYKFTTMNAVQRLFPGAEVLYKFINRGNVSFPKGFGEALRIEIDAMSAISLSRDAEVFMRQKCYYFEAVFIDLLKGYRYNPEEVRISQEEGNLEVEIQGLWYRTVLWEVPIMAIISELYFRMTGQKPGAFENRAVTKAKEFAETFVEFSEFGTRRRFSFEVQDRIVGKLKENAKKYLNGTSNLYLAMKHDLTPIGTHPHEWFMYHAANYGYRIANAMALENWVQVYQGNLGIALTDTYTTDNFLRSFTAKYARLFDGVRWDSGDPLEFTEKVIRHYKANRIDPKTKTIVYSDALNLEKVREIKKYVNGRIHDVYGIGTYLSNDVGVNPLNMVVKLFAAKPVGYENYIPVVKLSDVEGKHSGIESEIELCLQTISKY
jgi:nicotinate phosphoribosyltransferase